MMGLYAFGRAILPVHHVRHSSCVVSYNRLPVNSHLNNESFSLDSIIKSRKLIATLPLEIIPPSSSLFVHYEQNTAKEGSK